MPTWFPWIFVGGVLFIALSFLGAKFKDKQYKTIQYFQDFISGAILIGFLGVLAPDLFPKMEMHSVLPISMSSGFREMNEFDLQIGPPRLAGR